MEQVYQNAPAGKTAPLALMNLARIAQQEDDNDAAIDALDRLVNNHAQAYSPLIPPQTGRNLCISGEG